MKYWVWLSALRSLGAAGAFAAAERFGTPENLFFADEEALRAAPEIGAPQREEILRHDLDPAERILEQCSLAGLRVLTWQDADYPERLKNIYAPPCTLYLKGRLPVFDEEAALTVVGSRRATPYGAQAAERLSHALARAGMLIVSGLARGVDAHAHRAALRAGASTVAVLGCGADMPYPAENRALYEDIAAVGALVSEYPPGTPPLAGHFPARNRILSGLSLGVLVVEAPVRSGALITAAHAVEQGRDVFAVPGNIDVPESAGCNRLIREGAQLVTGPGDILEEYAALYPHKIRPRRAAPPAEATEVRGEARRVRPSAGERPPAEAEPAPRVTDLGTMLAGLDEDAQAVLIAVAGAPRHVDEIVEATGLPAARVLRALTTLELQDRAESLPGKRFQLAEGRA
ncbi:MAG: DNA-processing protein DprA [Oscillospiraceae bacterium]|jgi:DNA processing protein|nr:DNA-processing protein DprA [Oscillospiraceae bacterium]